MIFIQYTEKLFVKPSMLVELKKHTYNPMLKLFYLVISFTKCITEKRLKVASVNGNYKEFF